MSEMKNMTPTMRPPAAKMKGTCQPIVRWIVPATNEGSGPQRVHRFVEKPAAPVAVELMRNGGLWNSFILAASARTLLELFDRRLPQEVATLWGALSRDLGVAQRPNDLAHAYAGLGCYDFCRDVLEGVEDRLSVLPVPGCGWSDLEQDV